MDAKSAREIMIDTLCNEYMSELDDLVRRSALNGKDFLILPDHMTRFRIDGRADFVNQYLQGELASRGYSCAVQKNKIVISW